MPRNRRVMATRLPNRPSRKSAMSLESATFPNFVLCAACNRYIPRRWFDEHQATEHTKKDTTHE